jgi:hypothetical protein
LGERRVVGGIRLSECLNCIGTGGEKIGTAARQHPSSMVAAQQNGDPMNFAQYVFFVDKSLGTNLTSHGSVLERIKEKLFVWNREFPRIKYI